MKSKLLVVSLLIGLSAFGQDKYSGKDTTPYCKDVARSIELFTNFKAEGPLYPDWAKERAIMIQNNCNNPDVNK